MSPKQTKAKKQTRKPGGPSIREIAERLGLSKSAVALAVSTSPENCPLAPATRDRILAACDKMGYRVNSIARTMRTGQFNTISMIVGKISPYFLPAEMVYGVEDALEKKGYRLNITWLDSRRLTSANYVPKVLQEWSCDGLLIHYASTLPTKMIETIERHKIPTIWMNTKLEHDCVHPDDYNAAYEATQKLIQLGHKQIGYLHFHHFEHYSEADRYNGYKQAMSHAKLKPNRISIPPIAMPAEIREDPRHSIALEILKKPKRPTALLCYEIESAAPLTVAALTLGLKIPEDLSIVTFGRYNRNDTGISLSTIQLNLDILGRTSVEMILQKIKQPNKFLPPQVIPLSIDKNSSLAPPSKGK